MMELCPPNFKTPPLDYVVDDIPREWENFLWPTLSKHQEIIVINASILKHRIKSILSCRQQTVLKLNTIKHSL